MIKSIVIYNPESFFVKGEKISIGGEPTEIIVEKITYRFGKAKIKLSNGETIVFISNNLKIVYG